MKKYIPVTDENIKQIQLWFKREHGIDASFEMVKNAIDTVAKQNPVNLLDRKMTRENREELFRIRKNKSGH